MLEQIEKPHVSRLQKIILGAGAAITAVGVYLGVTTSEPKPSIVVDYFCRQTMSTQPQLVVYSGNQAFAPFQLGFAAVDAVLGTGYSQNGKGKVDPAFFCTSPIIFTGDCWQSVTRLAASPDTPKWIVWTGAPDMCTAQGLAVAKWNAAVNRYQWWGFINGSIDRLGKPLLDGDFAYAPEQPPSQTYMKFDLTAKTVVAGNMTEPVTPPVQAGIQTFTYTVAPILPDPPAPHRFTWTRHGAAPPTTPTGTATPVPTVTPSGPSPYAAWVDQLFREQITAGCGSGLFCPDRPLTRAEAAVWLLKTKYGSTYAPPPCTGYFADVPCGPQTLAPTFGPVPTKTKTPHIGPAPTKTNTPHIGPAPTP